MRSAVETDSAHPIWLHLSSAVVSCATMLLAELCSFPTNMSLLGGLYENEYILEDGAWKVFRLRCKFCRVQIWSNVLT